MTEVFSAPISWVAFLLILTMVGASIRLLPLGALSLPGITALTGLMYFYIIPAVAVGTGEAEFFGISLLPLNNIHTAAALYSLGAGTALFWGRRYLPFGALKVDSNVSVAKFRMLWMLAFCGMLAQLALAQPEPTRTESAITFGFLNLAYSLAVPLTIITLIRGNFNLRSVAVLCAVIAVFVFVGYRFRIVILACAAVSSYMLLRRVKLHWAAVVISFFLLPIVLNIIGATRRYYGGLEFASLEYMGPADLFTMFGGEVGPVFTLQHVASAANLEHIHFEPWLVAFRNLVPSFIWSDKPFPQYLLIYPAGFPDPAADGAGVAALQHAEFLLQFGWWGVPVLAFLYFFFAIYILRRARRLSNGLQLAIHAIVPSLFGFYMQQRGYFFQSAVEVAFTVGPIILLRSPSQCVKAGSCQPTGQSVLKPLRRR